MDDLSSLKKLGALKKYNEDDYIFYEGEPGSEMYIILSGKVVIYINSFDGSPIKVGELSSGNFFGEMAILEDLPRSGSAVALENTVLLSITKDNFEAFICNHPKLAHKIMKTLSSRIRSLNAQICSNAQDTRELSGAGSKDNEENEKAIESLTGSLFPSGHKTYSSDALSSNGDYLFDKQVKCPVCENSISIKMLRLSKLKLDKVEKDFRHRYTDFEPLCYSIWLCPHCSYANYYYEFETLPDKSARLIGEKIKDAVGSQALKLKGNYDINHVFLRYYIALSCIRMVKPDPLKQAKLWMQLSWLYKDAGDDEMHAFASSQALENYHNAYYNSKLSISVEQEQMLCIVLGELFIQKGDLKEASKHFYAAIRRNGGKATLNNQAQDRIQDLKEWMPAK